MPGEKTKAKKVAEPQGPVESVATSELIREVLDAEISNIIHDIVLQAHRQYRVEKEARPPKPADDAESQSGGKATPFTVDLPICPSCGLPRLLYPTIGVGSRPPPDPSISYCVNSPPICKAGLDVNGNPFATDKPPYKSKMKKSQKAEQVAAAAPSPNPSHNSGSPPQSPREGSFNAAQNQQGPTLYPGDEKKPAVSFPERKCPNCPRYLVVTKMARHLDRCLGLSGRQSSRNALEKMGTGTGNTPLGSRAGTPSATIPPNANPKKRAAVDDDSPLASEDAIRKKKVKLTSPKKKDTLNITKEKKGSGLKNGETIGETVIAVKKED